VAQWQCVGWMGGGSAVILIGGKSIIHFLEAGHWDCCVDLGIIIWEWVVARGVALAVGGVSVAVWLNEWQWHSGSALAGWGVAVRSF
jgi:hypothetical protein